MSETWPLGRGEGYEACGDDKRDKALGSRATPAATTIARSAGVSQVVASRVKTGQNSGLWRQRLKKSSRIKRLSRGQAPERNPK